MDETLIFLHIPRTAGTTLHRIIEQNYASHEIFSGGPDAHASVRAFRQLPLERRAAIRVLKGHLAYGIHDAIPGPATYLTLLRNPAERVISAYYYIKSLPKHPLYPSLERCGDLRGFIERGVSYMTDNGQTRLISGVWNQVRFGEMATEHLAMAKQNLCNGFGVVGLTERFDETLLLARRRFGWHRIFYIRRNAVAGRPHKRDLPPETQELLDQVTQLDHQLYAYAQDLFLKQLESLGAGYVRQLRVFQFYNGLFNRLATQVGVQKLLDVGRYLLKRF